MLRRSFLGAMGAAAIAKAQTAPALPFPVIDTHIHLFDPTRPQGVPWPAKGSQIFRPTLPADFRRLTAALGVKGAIEIECSPWLDDNQWVLDTIAKDSIMLGTVGDIEPDREDFAAQFERFHRDPLFLGIRFGNLWGRNLANETGNARFVDGLKLLAQAGLVLDTANPNAELIEAVVRVTDKVPDLRVVVDHLAGYTPPVDRAARAAYDHNLRELASRKQVYVKISQVLVRVDGRVALDLASHKPRLDELTGIFGEDHVLYGSDWPNSEPVAPYDAVFAVVREYFMGKGRAAAEKYFWKNSQAAYRWKERKG